MERWLIWLVEVLSPAVLAASVSAVYYRASPRSQPLRLRLLASAHGVAIGLLYALAWCAIFLGFSNPWFLLPFAVSLLVPAFLIGASFFLYKGPKAVHLLQALNVACLLWTGFTGSMLVTGQSP
jgi:hypothetical protein